MKVKKLLLSEFQIKILLQFMASEQESTTSDDENCSEMLSDEFSLQDSEDEPESLTGDSKNLKSNILTNGHQVFYLIEI